MEADKRPILITPGNYLQPCNNYSTYKIQKLSKEIETLILVVQKRWINGPPTLKKTTMLLLNLFSDTWEHFCWGYQGWGEEGNNKRKINRTVSRERLQLVLRATRKTKQMVQNQLQAPHMEDSELTVQRQVKRGIDGLISPQGVNTTQIHFSFFILPAIKSKQLARR